MVQYGGTVDYVSNFVYAPFATVWDQFIKVLNGLLESLGFSMESGNVFSVLGVINGVFFLYTLGFFISLRKMAGKADCLTPGRWYYLIFALLQFGVNVGVLIFSQLRDTGGINRYVWLGMIALLPILVLWESRPVRWLVCMVGIILCCLGNIQIYASTHRDGMLAQSYGETVFVENYRGMLPEEREGYLSFLKENQYHLGCATFSHANISTVLTNGEIRFITVNGDDGLTPMKWLASKSLAARRDEAEFILLTQEERQERLESNMSIPGTVVYEDALYVVYDLGEV